MVQPLCGWRAVIAVSARSEASHSVRVVPSGSVTSVPISIVSAVTGHSCA